MDALEKQVRRASRRINLQRFLLTLTWCWFAMLLVATGGILADWYWQWQVAPEIWVGSALGAGFLLAAVWTLVTRRGQLEAAIELDRRFGLKERVSSVLSLGPADLETEAGRALADDAVRRVRNVHVAERFSLRLNRWALLPLVPAIAAFCLAIFLPPLTQDASAKEKDLVRVTAAAIKDEAGKLRRQAQAQAELARQKNLKELEAMLKKFEEAVAKDIKGENIDRKEAVAKLNNLSQEMEDRKKELGGAEELKKQFSQLKGLNSGPGDKLADALRDGDLREAMKQIDDLKDKMKNGDLSKEQKEKLAAQLDAMQKKLQQMVDAQKKKQADLQKQLQQAKAAGNQQQAKKLQQQLNQMQQKDQQMQQMQQMAQQLGQCAQCMKDGNMQGAMQGLQQMQANLEDLQMQLDELEMLSDALDNISDSKNDMLGQNFMGQGGKGDGDGNGLGEGQGRGDRPEEATDNNRFVDTKAKVNVQQGGAVIQGELDGPNKRGNVREEIKAEVAAGISEESDPLTGVKLPKGVKNHAREYFDNLRQGK